MMTTHVHTQVYQTNQELDQNDFSSDDSFKKLNQKKNKLHFFLLLFEIKTNLGRMSIGAHSWKFISKEREKKHNWRGILLQHVKHIHESRRERERESEALPPKIQNDSSQTHRFNFFFLFFSPIFSCSLLNNLFFFLLGYISPPPFFACHIGVIFLNFFFLKLLTDFG